MNKPTGLVGPDGAPIGSDKDKNQTLEAIRADQFEETAASVMQHYCREKALARVLAKYDKYLEAYNHNPESTAMQKLLDYACKISFENLYRLTLLALGTNLPSRPYIQMATETLVHPQQLSDGMSRYARDVGFKNPPVHLTCDIEIEELTKDQVRLKLAEFADQKKATDILTVLLRFGIGHLDIWKSRLNGGVA